jgi:hypothetical protein
VSGPVLTVGESIGLLDPDGALIYGCTLREARSGRGV